MAYRVCPDCSDLLGWAAQSCSRCGWQKHSEALAAAIANANVEIAKAFARARKVNVTLKK